MKAMLVGLALFIATVVPVAADHLPDCCGWMWPLQTGNVVTLADDLYLTVVPQFNRGLTNPYAEVWYHPHPDPTSEMGWTKLVDVKPGYAVIWDGAGVSPGRHALALQVYDRGLLVHSWRTNSLALTTFEVVRR